MLLGMITMGIMDLVQYISLNQQIMVKIGVHQKKSTVEILGQNTV